MERILQKTIRGILEIKAIKKISKVGKRKHSRSNSHIPIYELKAKAETLWN